MIICVIPAKSDSRRLGGKNMALIAGRPMIYYSIRAVQRARKMARVYVSTDSEEIASYARAQGVQVIRRGRELGGDTPMLQVLSHAYESLHNPEISHVVCLQPDHPDRKLNVDEAIQYGLDGDYDLLKSVDGDGKMNGSFWMVKTSLLKEKRFGFKIGSVTDPCTNIHTEDDLLKAQRNISNKRTFEVSGKRIGEGCPAFVIAEGASNHMCDLDLAKRMIAGAREAGADAIKFQTYKAERLVTGGAESYWKYPGASSQFEYYKRLDRFGEKEYGELFKYAREQGIIAFSTPFDTLSASMLNDLGAPLFKIASCDIVDVRLLRHVAGFRKPVILSTGGSTLEEVRNAVNVLTREGVEELVLMVCTLSYPSDNSGAHLRRIFTFKKKFPELVIGLSDHTNPEPHMVIPSLAVAMGARVVEKHYTLDRKMTGSGHAFSVTPADLKEMIANIRVAEEVLGSAEIRVYPAEEPARANARRSIVAGTDIKKGEIITSDMLGVKRPGGGLSASEIDVVVGKRAQMDIARDQQIIMEMLEDP